MSLKIDQFRLVRAGSDGGDCCQRTFSVLLLTTLLRRAKLESEVRFCALDYANRISYSTAIIKLQPEPGVYIRSPDGDWTSSPNTVSRDQLTPVICFLATMSNYRNKSIRTCFRIELTLLLLACLKRVMFAQNNMTKDGKWKMPDFINPDLWAIFASGYVKTKWAPIAILFMLIGDAYSVLAALVKVFMPRTPDGALWPLKWNDPNAVDDTNINNCIIARRYNFPTPLSWLTRKIYKTFRKTNYGVTQLGEKDNVMGAIAWYNRNDNTDITELHRPFVERY